MLVLLRQAVLPRSFEKRIPFRCFIFSDHLFPAAGITGKGKTAECSIRSNQTFVDQWFNQRNETAGVAPGIGNSFGVSDDISVPLQLRKSVSPAGRGPMSSGCINYDCIRTFCKFDRLNSSRIRQTEKNDTGLMDRFFTGSGILAGRF